jgi:hypothetical protein
MSWSGIQIRGRVGFPGVNLVRRFLRVAGGLVSRAQEPNILDASVNPLK